MSRNLKLMIGFAVLVLGLGVALFLAEPKDGASHAGMDMPSQTQDQQNFLAIDNSAYDFGTISMKNGKVTKTFTVTNNKTATIHLAKLYTSCMCTDASIQIGQDTFGPFGMLGHGIVPALNKILEPNQQAIVSVTFDPNAHGPAGVGPIERTVTMEGDNGIIALIQIKANVTP